MINHDRPEDVLIDVTEFSLHQLGAEVDESSLGQALRRVLTPREERPYHGFSNTI